MKLIHKLLLAAAPILLMTACGGGDDNDDKDTDSSSSSGIPTQDPSVEFTGEPVTVMTNPDAEWVQIKLSDGTEAWLAARFLSPVQPQ